MKMGIDFSDVMWYNAEVRGKHSAYSCKSELCAQPRADSLTGENPVR